MAVAEVASALATRFPALFTPGAAKPLKLRIQADIQQRAPGEFTRKSLSAFLHRHTTGNAYLKALVAAQTRFDLDGAPAGEIAPEHREAAAAELARRRAIVQARRPAAGPMAGRARRPDTAAKPPGSSPADAGADRTREDGQGTDRGVESTAPARFPGRRPDRPDRPGRDARARGDARPQPGAARAPREAAGTAPCHPAEAGADRRGAPPMPRGGANEHSGRGDRPAHRPPSGSGSIKRTDTRPSASVGRPAAAPADPAWPADDAQRERALLLRAWESSPLAKPNFCALKRLSEADFDAQIAQARAERDARG